MPTADGDALLGAAGIHSTARAALYPNEGAPVWNGTMLWRGAADWPVHVDGRTMVIAGGTAAIFVFYPIRLVPQRRPKRIQQVTTALFARPRVVVPIQERTLLR